MDPSSPTTSQIDPFAELVNQLRQSLFPPGAASSPELPAGPMALPAPFSGAAENCSGFLLQCTLLFEMQPQRFPTDRAKIAFIISLLSGRALLWAKTIWEQAGPATRTLETFAAHFKEVFDQSANSLSVHDQLYHLKQGRSSVAEYAVKFRTLAAAS